MSPSDDSKDVMIAVTFAEAGEWETARQWAPRGTGRLRAWLERHLLAAALAEEGLHDDARRLVRPEAPPETPAPARPPDALDALLAAHGVRMLCGVLSPAALAARR